MAQVNIDIEMNEKLARRFEETCDAIGLDMEEAFNIFAQKVVNEKGIPFEVREEDYPDHVSRSEKLLQCAKKIAVIGGIAALAAGIAACCLKRDRRRR